MVIGFNFSAKLKAEMSVHEFYDVTQKEYSLNSGIKLMRDQSSLSLDLFDTYFLVYNKELVHNTPFS